MHTSAHGSKYIHVDTVGKLRALALTNLHRFWQVLCAPSRRRGTVITLVDHTQGIAHKSLRRRPWSLRGCMDALLGALRQAPSENPLAPIPRATTSSPASFSPPVEPSKKRHDSAQDALESAGLLYQTRKVGVGIFWRNPDVDRREQSARGAEQQGCLV